MILPELYLCFVATVSDEWDAAPESTTPVEDRR